MKATISDSDSRLYHSFKLEEWQDQSNVQVLQLIKPYGLKEPCERSFQLAKRAAYVIY